MFNKRWALIGALVLAAMFILAACGGTSEVQTVVVTEIVEGEPVEVVVTAEPEAEPAAPAKDTIIVCMAQEPDSLYNQVSTMAVSVQVLHASNGKGWIYDTGYFYATEMLENDTFPSFEDGSAVIEEVDGEEVLSVTFKFKDGMTWSDGEPFSVDDIIFTREVVLDPDSGVTSRGILDQMTFEKVDDLTLKVIYPPGVKDPTYFLPPLSSVQSTGGVMLPEHVLGSMAPVDIIESEFARMPNPVLGPYEYVEWVEGDHITLKAVEGWWGGEAKVPNVIFRFIADTNQLLASTLSGECDYATSDGLQLTQLPFIQQSAEQGLITYSAIPSIVWEHIEFNHQPPPEAESEAYAFFADLRVRQAISYGTNRQQMTEQILYGEVPVLDTFMPPDHWAYNPESEGYYPYDPEMAKQLLAEAGWEDADGDGFVEAQEELTGDYSCERGSWSIPAGTKFAVNFHTTTGNAMREQLSTLFQADMAAIGVQVNLDLLPASVWFADDGPLFTRTYQIGEFAWVSGPDPDNLGLFGGINIYRTPDGEFLTADKALEANPDLLAGLQLPSDPYYTAAGIADPLVAYFYHGRPTEEELPEGYLLHYSEQISDTKDEYEGQNDLGWCNPEVTKVFFDGANVIEPADRLPFYEQVQMLYLEDAPQLPLFQRVEVEAYAVDLCGPEKGPVNYAAWNIEDWYFGECE